MSSSFFLSALDLSAVIGQQSLQKKFLGWVIFPPPPLLRLAMQSHHDFDTA